ncbi:hypothetical protein L2E82_37315 [Cichorium intybus]|uniref:Uncharacterized protein n=1 Tax=Cichorium intybus TaxID=13427 RepID=A0ACB9AE10_CICIN|nr:hypothetical protein L2E82_37315 [Cichorium intybus]
MPSSLLPPSAQLRVRISLQKSGDEVVDDDDSAGLSSGRRGSSLQPQDGEADLSAEVLVPQNLPEDSSWDVVSENDLWEARNIVSDEDYVLVRQDDIVDGIACFMAAYLLSLKDTKTKSIDEFQNAYEEQSKCEAQKLIADVTSLVSSHISRQKEMVDARLAGIKETCAGSKTFLDGHVSSVEGITTDAKRKWQEFYL